MVFYCKKQIMVVLAVEALAIGIGLMGGGGYMKKGRKP